MEESELEPEESPEPEEESEDELVEESELLDESAELLESEALAEESALEVSDVLPVSAVLAVVEESVEALELESVVPALVEASVAPVSVVLVSAVPAVSPAGASALVPESAPVSAGASSVFPSAAGASPPVLVSEVDVADVVGVEDAVPVSVSDSAPPCSGVGSGSEVGAPSPTTHSPGVVRASPSTTSRQYGSPVTLSNKVMPAGRSVEPTVSVLVVMWSAKMSIKRAIPFSSVTPNCDSTCKIIDVNTCVVEVADVVVEPSPASALVASDAAAISCNTSSTSCAKVYCGSINTNTVFEVADDVYGSSATPMVCPLSVAFLATPGVDESIKRSPIAIDPPSSDTLTGTRPARATGTVLEPKPTSPL